jgi:hypothetical protein
VISSVNEEGINWGFEPSPLSISPDSDLENQDFTAVMLGDVSGSYEGKSRIRSFSDRNDAPEITAYPGDILSVPVVLNKGMLIEGIDLTAVFDGTALEARGISLTDTVLADNGYESFANIKENQISAAIFALTEPSSEVSGTLVFLNFTVSGSPGDVSSISLTRFDCNEIPVNPQYSAYRSSGALTGGFYLRDRVSRELRISVRTRYDLSRHDLNGDEKIGITDALYALKQGDIETAIRALQAASGIE